MLTRTSWLKLTAFALLGVLALFYTGTRYANLGRYLGLPGFYVVRLDLVSGGGIFPHADVTYRGAPVGRVGGMSLTPSGVAVDLDISDSAPRIPADLAAVVADQSAVGEQYVDLRPRASRGPYLRGGSVIPARDSQLPIPVTTLLTSIQTLVTSLPLSDVRSLTTALGTGFSSEGGNLRALLDGSGSLVKAANSAAPRTVTLLNDSRTVLATQLAESSALDSFGANAERLAHSLDESNGSLAALLRTAPAAAAQVAGLITDNDPALGALIANLLTTSEVTLSRRADLDELLSALPAAAAAGSTAITSHGASFGLVLTFFNPPPCTAGYGGTVRRNGLATSPGPPLNTAAHCAEPASRGDVRGAAHAPPGGKVPAPAQPGMAGLLGLSP